MEKKPGTLKLIGLPRLLYVIHRKGYPFSVLDVSREAVRKHFYFKDGRPVGSSSNVLNEVLGRLLMQEGVLTQELYERSLEKVIKEKRRHGEVLISMGLLTEAGLDEFLSLQTKRRIWKVFGWEDGEYRYRRTNSLPVGLGGPGFEPAELILEGISHGFYPPGRVIEELKEYMDKPVAASGEKARYNAAQFGLNLQESRFLASFDHKGKKTLKEAIDESDLLHQRSLALALSFIITDTVVAGTPAGAEEHREEHPAEHHVIEPTPGQASADERFNAELLFMKAKSAMNRGAWPDAVSSLKTITGLNPSEAEYQAYLGWAMFNENPDKAKESQEVIRAGVKLNKELSIGWRFLGLISLAAGDDASAFEELTEALNKNRWQSDILSEIKRLEIKKSFTGNGKGGGAAYMSVFGFKADPFSKVLDKRFFSSLSSQTRTLEALIKVVKHGAGHCLVTGADGIGKTTLALELLSRLGDEKILSVFVLDPAQTDLGFLKTLNMEAGEPVLSTSVKDQLLHIGMIVSRNHINNAGTLIIIDKAHVLAAEAVGLLQEIMRLQGLQILFLAEASFEETLHKDWFKEVRASISTRFALEPMTFEETEVYIMKRLEACYSNSPGFTLTDRALEHVFRESNGVPAKVNEVMSGLLCDAATRPDYTTVIDLYPKEEIKKPLPEEHKEPQPPHRPIKRTRPMDTAPKPQVERVETMPSTPKQENKQILKLLLWSLAMLAIGFFIGSLVGALR